MNAQATLERYRALDVSSIMWDPALVAQLNREEAFAVLTKINSIRERCATVERVVMTRLAEPPTEPEQADYIGAEDAARLAGLINAPADVERAVKRIYEWARDARWAKRPNRKTLLVNRPAFLRWLASRG